MAASYPNAVKTFSAIVDGLTKLIASLFNAPYDEITAIQTFIGAIGSTQAYSESLTNMLLYYIKGCRCEFKSTTDLYVRAGQIMIIDGSGNRRLRRNTADLTVDFTMLDTGSVANSTTYYIYAIADASGTTFTVKLSTSSSAPAGATFYRLIGVCSTDGSAHFLAGVVQSINQFSIYGEELTLATGTVYQALTDGEVTCTVSANSVGDGGYAQGLTDGSNPPTTVRGQASANTPGSGQADHTTTYNGFKMSVKKGNYYKVVQGVFGGATQPTVAATFQPEVKN